MCIAVCLDLPVRSTTGRISPLSTTILSLMLSFTSGRPCTLVFHFGRSPPDVLPTPISLHFFGGLTPISTKFVHILSPRLFHLSIRSSYSTSEGCHLLFRIRRMASGETLKCSASMGVVNLSGCVSFRCRMPSMVSGDSFLRGLQASPFSFSRSASFCFCHAGRSLDVGCASSSGTSSISNLRGCEVALSF
jgi:hypothetical protein